MNIRTAALALLGIALLAVTPAAAAELPVPPLTARVTDQTATLTREQVGALDAKLQRFEAQKGTQIAVLIVPTTGDETIEQYGLRVAEAWKLGRRKVDDGALLLIAKNDRTLRIEVGYGLEGALNDAIDKRIIEEVIVPRFRQGDFYGGIDAGVDRMIAVANGESLPAPQENAPDMRQVMPIVFILVVVVGSVLRTAIGRLPGATVTGVAAAGLAWTLVGAAAAMGAGLLAFLFTLLSGGGGHRGGWHSGGFGSGFGGGFGGGGGGFGGGGASGRW